MQTTDRAPLAREGQPERGDVLLAVDVGATTIKAGLVRPDGRALATASRPHGPVAQPGGDPAWLIWDMEALWRAVCAAIREVVATLHAPTQVRGLAVASFGADGAPVDAAGRQTYPVISWHCARTLPQMEAFAADHDPATAYAITGYHNYPINTLHRLRWLGEHAPECLDHARCWLMVADLLAYRLCGEMAMERTLASTTMARDLREDTWSFPLLAWAGVTPSLFPPLVLPGTRLGTLTARAAAETGLPAGTPVAAGGHDTEIAALGAGPLATGTVLDITGTWEIALAGTLEACPTEETRRAGLDWEAHALPGHFLCQSLMIAGGVVEWVLAGFYGGVEPRERYGLFIAEAATEPPGAGGVTLLPSFVAGMGPWGAVGARGTLAGVTTSTRRGQIARATLEGLCLQLRHQLTALDRHAGAPARRLRVLGGAQRNPLWLQLKADSTGRVVEAPVRQETTLLGAALLGGVGAGIYRDVREARAVAATPVHALEPNPAAAAAYTALAHGAFARAVTAMEVLYGARS